MNAGRLINDHSRLRFFLMWGFVNYLNTMKAYIMIQSKCKNKKQDKNFLIISLNEMLIVNFMNYLITAQLYIEMSLFMYF